MALKCPAAPESPADATYTLVYDPGEDLPREEGIVNLYRAARLVTITSRSIPWEMADYPEPGTYTPVYGSIGLFVFSKKISGIAWEALELSGYDVSLYVDRDGPGDASFLAHLKSLGCRVWDHGAPL